MPTERKSGIEADEWLSLNAAAALLGESRLTVLHRIVRGELEGKPVGGRSVVKREGVEAILTQRAGAPTAA